MTDLIDGLTQLTGLAQDLLWQHFVVFLRVGAAMAVLPAFGDQVVPVRVRLALAIALTLIVTPAVLSGLPALGDGTFGGLATEVLAGLVLGIALRLFVHALQIAAAIAAQATSLAQIFAGAGPEPLPAIGHLLTMAGLALAMAGGLPVRAVEYVILSYDLLPAGRPPAAADVSGWGVRRVAHAFALGFSLAAPFTVASLLYNLALGVINRAMPQLMVSFIGAPALTAGGLALLVLAVPLILAVWLDAFTAFLEYPQGMR